MDYRFTQLSGLDKDGISRLAKLHIAVMPTLLADLGLSMVLRYYQIAQVDRDVIGLCALSSSEEILGWAMGSPHPDALNSRLRKPLPWFTTQMLKLTFTHPGVLWQLISSVLSPSTEVPDGCLELTYIGVDSSTRKRGLGRALLNVFVQTARERGYKSVVLSVEEENTDAIALYTRGGFMTTKTFAEGRFRRHRMELALSR